MSDGMSLLRALFDSAPVAIYHADRRGHLTYGNPRYRAMFGLEPGQSLDEWDQAVHADDRPRVKSLWDEFFDRQADSMQFEYSAHTRSGEWRSLSEHVVAITEPGVSGFVGTITDVTELKAAYAELDELRRIAEAANRAKSEFLANMSHEIRTPLNGVIGVTELLSATPLNEDQRELVQIARSSGESLLAVLNDVLDFSKIEAQQLVLEAVDFDLPKLLEQAVDAVAPQAAEKSLDLIVDVDPALPAGFNGDPTRLRQVVLNLLSNAVKFTTRGEVRIAVHALQSSAVDTSLRVEVTDTGLGMTVEQCARLFNPFSQADASTTRRFGGTGLGLSICHRLVGLMGGSIGVTSTPGSGSNFWFELGLRAAQSPSRSGPRIDLSGCTVWVVDSHPVRLRVLVRQLVELGCEVSPWTTAAEAEPALIRMGGQGTTPDIVLIDGDLPDSGGPRLAKHLRAQPAGFHVSIVLMTALGKRPRDGAPDNGIDRVIMKPVKQAMLSECLRELVGIARAKSVHHAASAKAPLAGRRVLLAEDNVVNQKIGRRILERLGVQVTVVDNGRAAIDSLLLAPVDVILMDCQMPEIDGYEATRLIREGAAGAAAVRIPIIALTANALTGERDRCLAAGMDEHLTKPIDLAALRNVLSIFFAMSDERSPPSAAYQS